jgi:GDP-D-mannose dehydratase
MFTHTGPRRGDVFAESTFAKQIALAEAGLIPPVVKVGNLDSLRTIADVRDAVRAYHMAVTINPIPGSYYNIGGNHTTTVKQLLDDLILMSRCPSIKIEVDPDRLRPIDADLQIPDISKFTAHTSWVPEISYQKTMSDLLNYWRNEVEKKGDFLTR